ncbi:hypothetical protein [Rhodobacter ferrooxidans]|uniref:Lipoprotein n=1 Tax=Rhodobacter ferrooxidans TaxID=371731 RepID=C8S1G3_9RHOB|nr:hypothetical protein [Rhodobacter sp. SW2]EEW25136.1 hypothetical protein Rsw2DRAFT_1891 [Rhodobacter sp. SW2]
MSNSTRALVALCLVAFVAACAPKPDPVVMVDEPLTTEPVFHGKYGN